MKAHKFALLAIVTLTTAWVNLVPLTAAAADSHIDFGLRLGYGFPLGVAAYSADDGHSATNLEDLFDGQFAPLWVDVSYGFTPNISAGLYFSYALAFPAQSCPSPLDCSAADTRFGIQARYRVQPDRPVDLWVGVSAGYEWASFSASAAATDVSVSLRGFEFVSLQSGVDFRVADNLRVGPFASLSIGEYSAVSGSAFADVGVSASSTGNKGIHEWLFVGIAGQYSLGRAGMPSQKR